jgi:hypothetical protein
VLQSKSAPGVVLERALVRQLAVPGNATAARFEVIVRVAVKKSATGKRPRIILLEELTLAIDTLLQAYPGTISHPFSFFLSISIFHLFQISYLFIWVNEFQEWT